jgi:FMN phosphatase YigB (HAD superfamily)
MKPENEATKNSLAKNLKAASIKAILLDFDDTLIKTGEVFRKKMREFSEKAVAGGVNKTAEELQKMLWEENNKTYDKYAVNRIRWKHAVDGLKTRFDNKNDTLFDELYPIIMEVFYTRPNLTKDAMNVVETLFGLDGIEVAMVTHADKEWTDFKLKETGFDRFFNKSNTFIVNVDEFKGPQHWLQAIENLLLKPAEVMVVGDSLPGDICAAHEIGVKHKVWVPSSWSKYNEGEVPEGTYQIDSIAELIQVLEEALTNP